MPVFNVSGIRVAPAKSGDRGGFGNWNDPETVSVIRSLLTASHHSYDPYSLWGSWLDKKRLKKRQKRCHSALSAPICLTSITHSTSRLWLSISKRFNSLLSRWTSGWLAVLSQLSPHNGLISHTFQQTTGAFSAPGDYAVTSRLVFCLTSKVSFGEKKNDACNICHSRARQNRWSRQKCRYYVCWLHSLKKDLSAGVQPQE